LPSALVKGFDTANVALDVTSVASTGTRAVAETHFFVRAATFSGVALSSATTSESFLSVASISAFASALTSPLTLTSTLPLSNVALLIAAMSAALMWCFLGERADLVGDLLRVVDGLRERLDVLREVLGGSP
jgi:hypothetical protein